MEDWDGSVSEAENLMENASDEYASDVLTEAWEQAQQQRTAYILNVVPKTVHVSY